MVTPFPLQIGVGNGFIIADFFHKIYKKHRGQILCFLVMQRILLYFIELKAYNRYINDILVMI